MIHINNYISFKKNLKYETIDELLEDRKIYLLKNENNKYIRYIWIIEKEIERRLNRYGLSCLKKAIISVVKQK